MREKGFDFFEMASKDYKFTRIEDALPRVNQKLNLIGVVVDPSIPHRTRGTDCFCSIKIIDESRDSGMYVHFFTKSMETLPQVANVGDILIVYQVKMTELPHHIKIKTSNPEPFASFNKKYSSYALFDGRDSSTNDPKPYQSLPRYEDRDQNKYFIMGLRNSRVQQIIKSLNVPLFLREIAEVEDLTLLCKILHVDVNDNEPMLFVWDGTDTPPAPLAAKLEDEMKNPLPLQLEPSVLSRDLLCTFPTVGTVLRMSINQGDKKLSFHYFKPNRWVKLTKVKCEVRSALWMAVLMHYSKICYLRDDDDTVIDRIRSCDKRAISKWRRMPFTSFPWPSVITETRHPDDAFVTLLDVLTHPEVMCGFKCVVRVVAIYPWRAEEFQSPNGVYRVRFTLEDPTARIHAYLYAEDGVMFFGNVRSVDMLTKKMNKLLGVGDVDGMQPLENVIRKPPWIQCCLRSYKSHVSGKRNYRIFDTTFLG